MHRLTFKVWFLILKEDALSDISLTGSKVPEPRMRGIYPQRTAEEA